MASVEPHSTKPNSGSHLVETARYCVCDCCRLKKIKCDMVRPSCGSCHIRHTKCTYSKQRAKPGPPKQTPPANRTVAKFSARSYRSLHTQEQPFANPVHPDHVERAVVGFNDTDDGANSQANLPPFPRPMNFDVSLDGCHDLSSEAVNYLLHLYFQHIQPIYPLFRKQKILGPPVTSSRLKLAICTVASRFATSDAPSMLSTAELARLARNPHCTPSDQPSIDEIKASLLLCVHSTTEAVNWDTIAEIAKVARKAELYHAHRVGETTAKATVDWDAEEWSNVWWTIYALDTCYSAITMSSHSTATYLQDCIEMPTVSVSEFTASHPDSFSLLQRKSYPQWLPSSGAKHWETMQISFRERSRRTRSMYLCVSSLMRAVTELRILARYNRGPAFYARLHNLEDDCANMTFGLHSWTPNSVADSDSEETAEEHRHRLGMMLVFHCARLLLKTTAAQVTDCGASDSEDQMSWQAILSEANEIVLMLQYWGTGYLEVTDPMCSHIVFLTASVLIVDCKAVFAGSAPRQTNDIDLLVQILGHIGQHWPIGKHLKNSLNAIQAFPPKQSYREMLQCLLQITSPLHGALAQSDIAEDRDVATSDDYAARTTTDIPLPEDVHLCGDISGQMGWDINLDDMDNTVLGGGNGYGDLQGADIENIFTQL